MTAPDGTALRLRGLAVGYGHHPVVEALDLDVPAGGMLALMGTNGSGKSTLLKTLAGLQPPLAGEVTVLGAAPGASPTRVAYLCQDPPAAFTLPLRASDVVAMGRFARLGLLRRPRAEDRAVVRDAMDTMGVTPFQDRPLSELSGGQQQRTHLAQALARRAEVLLVDEPTAGLDAAGREAFNQAVAAERARGCAVVMATHDIDDAQAADIVVLLAQGIVAVGPPAEVLTDEHLRVCFGFTGRHHGHRHDHDH
jgi:ABC-type Mn2+/Zn2+ transport system ATPase subunit